MVNKNYIAGRNFEYKVKKYYENQGFTVLRTSGSHGFADLVAIGKFEIFTDDVYYEIRFIQCKNRKPTKKEINDLFKFKWIDTVWFNSNDNLCTIKTIMLYPERLKELKANDNYD